MNKGYTVKNVKSGNCRFTAWVACTSPRYLKKLFVLKLEGDGGVPMDTRRPRRRTTHPH